MHDRAGHVQELHYNYNLRQRSFDAVAYSDAYDTAVELGGLDRLVAVALRKLQNRPLQRRGRINRFFLNSVQTEVLSVMPAVEPQSNSPRLQWRRGVELDHPAV
jgi:hypothetical protein